MRAVSSSSIIRVDRQIDRLTSARPADINKPHPLFSPCRAALGTSPAPDPSTCFCTPDFRGLELARLYRRLRPLPFALFLTEKYTRTPI